jgi:membrane protease YdiL (CAAX protease family)
MNRTYQINNQPKSIWLELLITLLGIIGVILFLSFYDRALPSAAIDLKYSRDQISQLAESQLRRFGYSTEGYEFALSFNEDNMASYYLQRKLGVEVTNTRLANEKWPLHYWAARWYKPMEKEEFYLHFSPQGEFLGFNHVIAEDSPGASITIEQAQVTAENFLTQYSNWTATDWERVEASSEAMSAGRVDHTFVWKSKQFSADESELRYSVTVQGDQVGDLRYWIKIPETFSRDFSAERDRAGFINIIALILGFGGFLMVAAAGYSIARPDLRRILRPALLSAVVSLAASINFIPLYRAYYDTTQDYTLFWVMAVIGAIFSALYSSLLVFFGWGGGQGIAKLVWHNQDRILARGPNRWVEFSRSAWRGLMLGGFNLGYVVMFYLFATNVLGWWSPVSAEYSDAYATPFPFLLAFDIGLNAALTEELLFRLIGISFFLWLFPRKRWLAVLIPGMIWAFAHTSYVSHPIYARGIELTIHAIIMGIVFLKFDLFTTIMAHFTYNMLITAMPLLRSSDPYFQFSGMVVLAVLVLPLLPGLYLILKLRFSKSTPLPDSFSLSAATESDLPKLSAFPVTADWHALLKQTNRAILCLRSRDELIGFATGYMGKDTANIDGVYIIPQWRRQYWGAKLLDAIQQHFKDLGVEAQRAFLLPSENKHMAFLNNLFWRPGALTLTPHPPIVFSLSVQELKTELRERFINWKISSKSDKPQEIELEIPRDLL